MMHLRRYACAIAVAVLAAVAAAAAGVAVAAPAAAGECRFTDTPIVVDGRADEAAWQEAAGLPPNAIVAPAATSQSVKLLWDRESLYLLARLGGPQEPGERGSLSLLLVPGVDQPAAYEFRVTAAGATSAAFLPGGGKEPVRAAAPRVQAATVADAGGWTVEMRVPWTACMDTGGRPEPGTSWRLAVVSGPPAAATPEPPAADRVAAIRFDGPPAVNPSRPYGIPTLVPVTTSKLTGSPDPPLPYTVERVLPLARVPCPIVVAHQPGSDRLLYATEPRGYKPSQLMRMRDDPESFEPETLLAEDGHIHYSICFHPQFAANGYVYVGSNGPRDPGAKEKVTRITRYVIDREPPYAFHPESARIVIEWESDGHNGGDIAFGPDGMLYVTSGDGSSDSDQKLTGQDLSRLQAKVLRIDVDHPDPATAGDRRLYGVPADNPFVGVPGARPETWAYGLRNPWRMTIDRESGQIWVGNNGQDLWEQVYLIERGANYGWSVMEGGHPFDLDRKRGPTPILSPTAEHSHSEARSLTGGIVYRGRRLPELRGAYIYGDYSTGRIWGIRHDGKKVTWHEPIADTQLQITCFATDANGEILIADHQVGTGGGFYTLIPRPAAGPAAPFPRRLSETGLFASIPDHRMVPGVIPYIVNSPLWSDGTHKARFFVLPNRTDADGNTVPATIFTMPARGWQFPDGSVLVKSFAIDAVEGDPATRRWIETRFMLKEQGEWAGYSYEWNDDQTDAVLVESPGKDRDFTIRTTDLDRNPDGVRTQTWHYPSRTECMVCHSRASNYVLGLCTVQLNRDFDYAATLGAGHATDNQLRTYEHLGILAVPWSVEARLAEAARDREAAAGQAAAAQPGSGPTADDFLSLQPTGKESKLLALRPEDYKRLADPHDASQPLGLRAQSYLQSNCASCHVYAGGGNAMFDLDTVDPFRVATASETRAVDALPMHHTFGLPDARIIAAGHPERSVLLTRVSRRGPGQMPQLATAIVDEKAVALLRAWIESLPPAAPDAADAALK